MAFASNHIPVLRKALVEGREHVEHAPAAIAIYMVQLVIAHGVVLDAAVRARYEPEYPTRTGDGASGRWRLERISSPAHAARYAARCERAAAPLANLAPLQAPSVKGSRRSVTFAPSE